MLGQETSHARMRSSSPMDVISNSFQTKVSPPSSPIPIARTASPSQQAGFAHGPITPPTPPRGRNALHRLRIGSSGSPHFTDSSPVSYVEVKNSNNTDTSASPVKRSEPSSSLSRSERGSYSQGSEILSPAASFLSSFSNDSRNGSFFPQGGDAEGVEIAGYILGKEIGHGGFGLVREARKRRTTGHGEELEIVAAKIVHHTHAVPVDRNLPGSELLRRSMSSAAPVGRAGIRLPRKMDLTGRPGLVAKLERHRSASSPAPPQALVTQQLSALPSFGTALGISVPAESDQLVLTDLQIRGLSASLSKLPSHSRSVDGDGGGAENPVLGPNLVQSLLEREILLWQQLAPHPHIVPLLAVEHTQEYSYIFMPLCRGGNLLNYLKTWRKSTSSSTFRRKGKKRTSEAEPIAGSLSPTLEEADGAEKATGLPLHLCLPIFAQVVEGLHYLHTEAKVTHKDIKLENILCDEPGGAWKIADFGLAETAVASVEQGPHDTDLKRIEKERLSFQRHAQSASDRGPSTVSTSSRSPVNPGTPLASLSRASSLSRSVNDDRYINDHLYPAGSLPYAAPEQMRSPTPILDPSVDIWALGCVLYALVEGKLPIQDEFEPRLRMNIMKGAWEIPTALQTASVAPCNEGTADTASHYEENFVTTDGTATPSPSVAEFDGNSRQRSSSRGRGTNRPSLGNRSQSSRSRLELEKGLAFDVLRGCLEFDPKKRWTIDRIRSSDWLRSDKVSRGRAGQRVADVAREAGTTSSSRSPNASASRSRRKERSTSRNSAVRHTFGIDTNSHSGERQKRGKEDARSVRNQDKADACGFSHASQSRGRSESKSASGSGQSRSASRGSRSERDLSLSTNDRLGRGAEPY